MKVYKPRRLGTYQWEGLSDAGAEELIMRANNLIDEDALAEVVRDEDDATSEMRDKIRELFEDED